MVWMVRICGQAAARRQMVAELYLKRSCMGAIGVETALAKRNKSLRERWSRDSCVTESRQVTGTPTGATNESTGVGELGDGKPPKSRYHNDHRTRGRQHSNGHSTRIPSAIPSGGGAPCR